LFWSGWVAIGQGDLISRLDLREGNPANYDFKAGDKKKYKIFIEAYENQFRKHGWFPKDISKDTIEFELKLIEWKKHLKKLEIATII
jgi:plasmid replication initiation protein